MMWKYIYAAFLMIAFTACHTNKTLEKSDKPASTANYTLPEHLSVSASFRMFWDAWNADLRQSGNNLEKVGSINSIFYFLHKAAEPFNCLEQDNLA